MSFNSLSLKARKQWLKKARLIRKERAELKKGLKKGRIELKTVFLNKKTFNLVSKMRLIELLSSLPGYSRQKAKFIMTQELNISLSKRVRGLGKNQRERFFNYFKIG